MKIPHRKTRLLELLVAHADTDLANVQEVRSRVQKGCIVTENVVELEENGLTFGQRAADRVAGFGGSWTFIILFGTIICGWMLGNIVILASKPFDPYPFILLNLVLSCLAALQAPIIMMSQGRQDARDRIAAENDYRVNLKAELEIREMRDAMERLHLEHRALLHDLQQEIGELRRAFAPTPDATS